MEEIEIEKRYLIDNKTVSVILTGATSNTIVEDYYVPNGENHKDLRLRHSGDRYMITRKTPIKDGDKLVMKELTLALSKEEFEAMSAGIETNVSKTRVYSYCFGYECELGLFNGRHSGLNILEFEFSNKEDVEKVEAAAAKAGFIDVTNDKRYAGGNLANLSTEEADKLIWG